jgi:basic amino acid/polyamine antiporter, APA family
MNALGDARLQSAIGRSGYFTLAFGAIVGSGWVVILGSWLKAAGPLGVVLGFVAGGVAMMLTALCYGELTSRFSHAGGEFLYTLRTLGPFAGFIVGWFLTLYSIAVCAFEAIALGWLVRTLVPRIALGTVYRIAGAPVTWDALLLGVAAALILGALHYNGARAAIRFQNTVTLGFIGVSILLILCGLVRGKVTNLQPLVAAAPGHQWLGGSIWIFSTCAFFLNGWQAALHAIEERRTDVSARSAVMCMVAGVGAGAAFYSAIVLAASMSLPWPALVGKELPAVAAFRDLGFGGWLGTLVLVAAIVSLTKTWSAMVWIASRVVLAQARHGLVPRRMAGIDPKSGVPRNAIIFVTLLTLVGLSLGRSAILPIVDMVSICLALSIILCLALLLRQRRMAHDLPSFTVPGGTPVILCALGCATLMVAVALLEPVINGRGKVPPEWILLGVWAAAGIAVWFTTGNLRQRQNSAGEGDVGPVESTPH